MSLIHERTFRVRHYECDMYGHLNNAVYLRYMQEAAFDASAAAGYDLQRYDELGRTWLARETDIEYLQPLRYGDAVTVRTWVADFRHVRSRRVYEFYRDGTDELAARATTDWVYLDSATGRPAAIPPGLARAFFPGGTQPPRAPREPFPAAPPPPPGVFTIRRRVAWADVDPLGHVNNAMYLAYVEECGVQVAAAFGWPMARSVEVGFAIVARRHRIEYQQSAVMDDELEVATWISDVKRATCFRHYTIRRVSDGALLARARTLWVWVDLASGRPIRIPPHFLADFEANIAQG